MRIVTQCLAVVWLITLVSCAIRPAPSVKDGYLAQRLAVADPKQPCLTDAFALTHVKIIHNRLFMPVIVNGVPTVGVLDTGADISLVTPDLAQAAGLKMLRGQDQITGVAGSFSAAPAVIRKLQVGTIAFDSPQLARVVSFGGSQGTTVGVQIGLDWLEGLDYDIDLPQETFRPYRTSNCITVDPPWHDSYTGLVIGRGRKRDEYGQVRYGTGFPTGNELTVPVVFEGSIIDATLDTGSTNSLLSHDAALDVGVRGSELRNDKIVSAIAINGKSRKLYSHSFVHLAIGEEELRNFPILVTQYFDRRDTPMLLGMDYIKSHHLWLSLTTNALFIDSGERRKPTPPFDHAHWIAGPQTPSYPKDGHGEFGTVDVQCRVSAEGAISDCIVTEDAGHKMLSKAAMDWLTGDNAPVMQPAYRDGQAVAELHKWSFNFSQ